jgi:Txe/YoeB family toxin of Txe-Axe toxin-antitoxin module
VNVKIQYNVEEKNEKPLNSANKYYELKAKLMGAFSRK